MACESCKKGEEHHYETTGFTGIYGAPEQSSPTGITQGGCTNNIVVREYFAIINSVTVVEKIAIQKPNAKGYNALKILRYLM